ncbi:MAG: ABC transporter substrate-binding protein [Gammaproteobacteria bacterium]|nr:ABC transporter substrate-binding protein [Gammaproteobacteria bacterium]
MGGYRAYSVFLTCILVYAGISKAQPPSRVVSINLCSDQLLLMLARPRQIASISRLALEPNSSYMSDAAAGFPVNDAKLEQLLSLDPDLILAGGYSSPSLIRLLKRLGYRVEIVPSSVNLEQIHSNIRLVARLVGDEDLGETIIEEMNLRVHQISVRSSSTRNRALFYQPRGYTSGSGTLQDLALTLAGWRNLSAELGVNGYGSLDLESLLISNPDQIFTSAYAPETDSVAQRQLRHPALAWVTGNNPLIDIPYRYWICGGPMLVDAVEALADAHQRLH